MVRSSVTTESHPASLTNVTVAVLLELVYIPSIQVKLSQWFEHQHSK